MIVGYSDTFANLPKGVTVTAEYCNLISHLVPRQHAVVVLHVLLQGGPAARHSLADRAPQDRAAGGGGSVPLVRLADMSLELELWKF